MNIVRAHLREARKATTVFTSFNRSRTSKTRGHAIKARQLSHSILLAVFLLISTAVKGSRGQLSFQPRLNHGNGPIPMWHGVGHTGRHGGYPMTELDLPASERNSLFSYFPMARGHWKGPGAGHEDILPMDQLVPQQLNPHQHHEYIMRVPQAVPGMSITVHPRRGFVTWNVSKNSVNVMTHPFYTMGIPQRLPVPPGERASQARPDSMHPGANSGHGHAPGHDPYGHHSSQATYYGRKKRSVHKTTSRSTALLSHMPRLQVHQEIAKSRVKRCCISGAPPFNYDYDVVELNGGLGKSIGPGSITYFKEDINEGDYIVSVTNWGGSKAEFLIFATLLPEQNPYPRMQGNDPQVKVRTIEQDAIEIFWEPPPEQPGVVFCPVFHTAEDHVESDVHSSSFAQWLERRRSFHPPCVAASATATKLRGLEPNTEYHIDLLVRNTMNLREGTFMGVIARTQPYSHIEQPLSMLSRVGDWYKLMWKDNVLSGAMIPARTSNTSLIVALMLCWLFCS